MKLVVTIPAFNEEKTIGKVIEEIPKKIEGIDKIEVLVIDDGSTDSTQKIAASKGAKVIRNASNKGLAFTFSRGMEAALEMNADIIVNTDADFQYDQSQIPRLVKPIIDGKAELVLGSRFMGKIEEMPFHKKLGNRIVSMLVSTLTGEKILDSQTGFRAFSREAALQINIFSDYTYTQETILEANEKKITILEVPADFRKRAGKSRLISNIFTYAQKVGFTILETYLNYRPLRVFLSFGLILLAGALFFGGRALFYYLETGLVANHLSSLLVGGILMILGFEVVVLGFIAEIIKRNRRVQEKILYYRKKDYLGK